MRNPSGYSPSSSSTDARSSLEGVLSSVSVGWSPIEFFSLLMDGKGDGETLLPVPLSPNRVGALESDSIAIVRYVGSVEDGLEDIEAQETE